MTLKPLIIMIHYVWSYHDNLNNQRPPASKLVTSMNPTLLILSLSGNFLRHSDEFHYWRIQDREGKLAKAPDSLAFLDDLAVSFSKTGNDSKAIKIALRQLQLKPDHYE